MPYSHHSHSGQFCAHAKNTLEEVVQTAIARGFQSYALTEHMHREKEDFYPEEESDYTEEGLVQLTDAFYAEAVRLRETYTGQIALPVAFETEWIRPSTLGLIRSLVAKHPYDFLIGSVHHVHTVPIDFDKATYQKAREIAGGTDERLFEDYFDSQYEMLQALQPAIVGHFDLIRLMSDEPNAGLRRFEGVWTKALRNLEYIISYDGVLELNSAALRKGLDEPYPCLEVCEKFLRMGGRFSMSDDSHGVEQIGTNYRRLLHFIQKASIPDIHIADCGPQSGPDRRSPTPKFSSVSISQLEKHAFWAANP
ncbi:histidinol-phosphatase [Lophium mytilinum]|uniref:Histidinol-phosphatase n=1 Tax=Lophium mytilinum TaxID=390894 RepID=A0A6A6QAL3_9PEZI|nr:histidinol-phosphatase [Lophium mytilinum]